MTRFAILLQVCVIVSFWGALAAAFPFHSVLDWGEWRQPEAGQVRSPCPALNTLANHGLLPRNGRNIPRAMMSEAIQKYFNMDRALAFSLTKIATSVVGHSDMINLDRLSKHGFIEHDASLVHDDTALGDNSIVNQNLVNQLIEMSDDGQFLTVKDLGRIRKLRVRQSREKLALHDKSITFGFKEEKIANSEAAFLLLALNAGDGHTRVPVEWAQEFLKKERFPLELGWTPVKNKWGFIKVNSIGAAVKRAAR